MNPRLVEAGKKIKEFRIKNNDTLVNLANYLNIDVGNLSKIENGKRGLSKELLDKISHKYNLNLEDKQYLFATSGYYSEGVSLKYMEQNIVKEQTVQVPNNLPVLFSDVIGITSSQFGLVLDFGQRLGSTNQTNVVARVGISKEHGEALLKVLTEKIKEMQLLTKKTDKKDD